MTNRELKLIRLYEGHTQTTFGEKYDLGKGTIAKIERNWIGVSDVTKSKVLRQFDVGDPGYIEFCKHMNASEAQ